MRLSEELTWRGLVKDKTFDELKWLDKPQSFYHGVDGSSDSLTIGNLAALMLARRLAEAGWTAVLLVGGATSLIGDPGGKTIERQLPDKQQITGNIKSIAEQIQKLFAGTSHQLVNNIEWLKDVRFLDFLRDVGKNYSMTELMQRDFVDARMGSAGSGISYAEFSYSLIQGFDYWNLYKRHGVILQVGGSDQWGNMLSGVSLVRKKEGKEVHALSMPLVVNKTTGVKFGKTESGAVWLDARRTPPEQFYQFWINAADDEVEDYLKIFTLLGRQDIEQVMSAQKAKPSSRAAQKKLAEEVTRLVHGQGSLDAARKLAELSIGAGNQPAGGGTNYQKLDSGVSLRQALVATGLAASGSEAQRLIDEKAVYLNNRPAAQDKLEAGDFSDGRLVLRRGKKYQNSAFVELV